MSLAHIRAVCWDWNGTLLDDAEICRQVMNTVLVDHGREPLADLEAKRSVFRFPIREIYRSVGVGDDSFVTAASTYLARLAMRVAEPRLHEGALRTGRGIGRLGVRPVLATATVSDALARQMAPHGLDRLFEAVLAIDDPYRASKHEVIRGWLTTSGLEPADVLIIGDTNHDHEIAEDLGTEFLHFEAGHGIRSGEARRISALDELLALLGPPRRLALDKA